MPTIIRTIDIFLWFGFYIFTSVNGLNTSSSTAKHHAAVDFSIRAKRCVATRSASSSLSSMSSARGSHTMECEVRIFRSGIFYHMINIAKSRPKTDFFFNSK